MPVGVGYVAQWRYHPRMLRKRISKPVGCINQDAAPEKNCGVSMKCIHYYVGLGNLQLEIVAHIAAGVWKNNRSWMGP